MFDDSFFLCYDYFKKFWPPQQLDKATSLIDHHTRAKTFKSLAALRPLRSHSSVSYIAECITMFRWRPCFRSTRQTTNTASCPLNKSFHLSPVPTQSSKTSTSILGLYIHNLFGRTFVRRSSSYSDWRCSQLTSVRMWCEDSSFRICRIPIRC